MAYYDHQESARILRNEKSYQELKEFIQTLGEDRKMNKFYPAYEHLMDMERHIKKQNEELENYKQFFGLLSSLLPRQFSIHDRIG
jgi:hypothetical protein